MYWDGTCFRVEHDSCVCRPCYEDYKRHYRNHENTKPGWAKKKEEYYQNYRTRHCLLCCDHVSDHGHCRCSQITRWGPEQWQGLDEQSTWKKFLCVNGYTDPSTAEIANHVCRVHYRRITEIKESRSCQVCTTNHSDSTWKLVGEVTNNPDDLCKAFSLPMGSTNVLGWICNRCELCYKDVSGLCTRLEHDITSTNVVNATRAKLNHDTVDELS